MRHLLVRREEKAENIVHYDDIRIFENCCAITNIVADHRRFGQAVFGKDRALNVAELCVEFDANDRTNTRTK